MRLNFQPIRINFTLFFICLFTLTCLTAGTPAGEKLSAFGQYQGYSIEKYDSWVRTSRYLTMRDGVKLAIDIIRPAINGKIATGKLPVIWTHTRYRRAVIRDGQVSSRADAPSSQKMLKHGYVVAVADVRGSGASFGTWQGIFSPQESQDAYEITEWLASQPWCSGSVGMFGGSYLGVTQLMCAGKRPEHLKAIFPAVALFDIYTVAYHGGIFFEDFIKHWSDLTQTLDTISVAAPVDGDIDKKLLAAAIKEHRENRPLVHTLSALPFRDSKDEFTGEQPYYLWHPAAFIEEINLSKVPIYLWCGWFDSFTKDGFLMYRNFNKNPRKMVIGAWSHSPRDPEVLKELAALAEVEQLRWFDYWLKGINNGIMAEPPIHYHLMRGTKQNEWRTAHQWPLPEQKPGKYYFQAGPSNSIKSVNDGVLDTTAPTSQSGSDSYTADYSTTSGTTSRWDNAVGQGFGYPDMTGNDAKGLTYTTLPLTGDINVTGHPLVRLWVSATAPDVDLFVFLEEVDKEGVSHYVSEGSLRASHRVSNKPYYDNLGLPYLRSHKEDVKDLSPGEPTELVFDLQPTAAVFDAGHRVRVTITCADRDNARTPRLSPLPVIKVYRHAARASHIVLPVIGQEKEEAAFTLILFILVFFIILILVFAFTFTMRKRITRKE